MKFAIIQQGEVINTVVASGALESNWVDITSEDPMPGIGWTYELGVFHAPAPPDPTPDPAEWFIDVGPFFDRFGVAKMNVLVSANATVQALVKDLQIRKWVDLNNAQVPAGIDALIALGVSGVDSTLKTAILTTPVSYDENMALRRLYF